MFCIAILVEQGTALGLPFVRESESRYSATARWLFKAAYRGFPEAAFHLGSLLEEGSLVGTPFIRRRENNLEAAARWYAQGARLGNMASAYSAGLLWLPNDQGVGNFEDGENGYVIALSFFEMLRPNSLYYAEAQVIIGEILQTLVALRAK